jgi:DNA-binding transcriptional regulator LsrR (DeoR family)
LFPHGGGLVADYQLAQIAVMHFENGMSQQEIADKLGLSKMTVSRMLQKAKEQDVVRTSIQLPFSLHQGLGNELVKRYGLTRAIVLKGPANGEESIPELIGRVYSFYMGVGLPDDFVLGMGVGNTIGQMVRNVLSMKTNNLHIVQLMGGLADVTFENPFTIVQETCRKLNAKGTYFTSFATVENKELRDSLVYNTAMGQEIMELWKKCDKALFGVGAIEKGTLLSPKLVAPEEIEKTRKLGAIGDILGHCFSERGEFIQTDLEDRLVSIPVDMLRSIEERVALAGGEFKARAIQGALRSGIITALVTDEKTASLLME